MPDVLHATRTSTAFALDGVAIKLDTRFLPGETFAVSDRGDQLQAAIWSNIEPASELAIIAAPFGTKPPTENVPPAAPGIEEAYIKGFDSSRQAGDLQLLARSDDGPTITIFGTRVQGKVVLARPSQAESTEETPTLTVEWVAEAGERLWIVRASQEMAPSATTLGRANPFLEALADTVLSSDTLDQPTTVRLMADPNRPPESRTLPGLPPPEDDTIQDIEGVRLLVGEEEITRTAARASRHLPTPPWWKGVCDLQNFKAKDTSNRASFPLSSGFRGVVPCGPLPGAEGDVVVLFHDEQGNIGAGHGEFEYQCVELSMRFMQMAFDITAYPGNGSQVVPNFATTSKQKDRDKMEIIQNGQSPPAPVPGDILSYGPVTTVGHTSVCMASSLDGNGDGSITVMEQNRTSNGTQVLKVKRWQVQAVPAVTSFLHFKAQRRRRRQPAVSPMPVLFPETGQFVGGGFKALWFKPGNGIFLCGFPLTGEQSEGALIVQFFENVKMEFQPGIQPRFGPVGRAVVEHPKADLPAQEEPTGPGTRTFKNGHSVGPEFLALFDKYGQNVCGEPITGEMRTKDLIVQYFENVKMERNDSLPARFGAAGRRFLKLTGVMPDALDEI